MSSTPLVFDGLAHDAGPHGVLMLHGLGSLSMELARLARDLHAQGFTVRVPNLEGYCYGSEPEPWQAWVAHARVHLETLRTACDTVSVVGLSMGATLALVLAQEEDLNALVALSTALAYDGWAMPWYHFLSRWAGRLPFADRYRYVEREPFGVKNEGMRTMIRRAMQRDHISESGADVLTSHQVLQGQHLIRAAWQGMADVASPVLFVHAVDDETVHVRNVEEACRRVASDERRVLYLGDSYHMITVDNERETVSQETSRFLKRCVNRSLERAAFEMPPLQSPELRRLLRRKA